MLKRFLFQFRVGYNQAVANEMCGVAMTFRGAEPVEIRLLFLDHAVRHWIDSKPGGNRETILIGPGFDRGQNNARTISAGKVKKFVGPVSVRKIFEDIQ